MNSLRSHASDMGRIALMSAHLRERGVSTPTVQINKLADALQATVEHVLQSQDTLTSIPPSSWSFSSNLEIVVEAAVFAFFRLEVENFIRAGALGFVDPELGFGEGMCMLMAVVMATVGSVQPAKGSVIDLHFLPIAFDPQLEVGDINQLCRRVVPARIPEDFIPAYEGFANLCFMVWSRVRARFLSVDPYMPSTNDDPETSRTCGTLPGGLHPCSLL
jgi:hypothetical protein